MTISEVPGKQRTPGLSWYDLVLEDDRPPVEHLRARVPYTARTQYVPVERYTTARPTASEVPGTENAIAARTTRTRADRRGSLAAANPAHDATTTDTGTTIAATHALFQAIRPNGTSSDTRP